MIWFQNYKLEEITSLITTDNILDHLGIEFVEIGSDFVRARMPVDKRTHQIHGILHGGATCVLAETLGSFASLMCVDLDKYYAVGSVITANHLRPVESGHIAGTCRPVHVGRSKHVWDIMVHSDEGKPVAKCELTCAVTEKKV